ncbi:heat shock 70 kDa protein 15-like protein [Tanacetum coccineum]
MRNKLHDNLHEFVMEPENARFLAQLQETEDWFYEIKMKLKYKQAAAFKDCKYEHIDINEKQKVLNEFSKVENWKSETLDMLCRAIMMKLKQAPPKPATLETLASPAPAQSGEQPSQWS